MMPDKKVSILIATYNEEENIARAIEGIRSVLPQAEIVVADDGSRDRTVAKAKRFESDLVKVIPSVHRGKGVAIREAIQVAKGIIMAQIDADLQFPAAGLVTLIEPILEDEADIVLGSRYLDSSRIEKGSISFMKRLASYVIARVISSVCGRHYTDIFAGFKAWKAEAIRDINIQEEGFAYEAEIVIKAKRHGYTVIEVPTSYKRRLMGKSKIRLLYHTLEVFGRLIYLLFFTS